MGNFRDMTELESNGIYDSCVANIYDTIDEEIDTQKCRANEETTTDLYMRPVYRYRKSEQNPGMASTPKGPSFCLRHKVNMQIDLKKDDKEDVDIGPKMPDEDFYLHPISYKDSEKLLNEKRKFRE